MFSFIASGSDGPLSQQQVTSSSTNTFHRGTYNLQEVVYNNLSEAIMNQLRSEKSLEPQQIKTIVNVVSDFLISKDDMSAKSAGKMSQHLCRSYPRSFECVINGVNWTDGEETLKKKIINCIFYKKSSVKIRVDTSSVLDEEIVPKKRKNHSTDEYRCVDYAPLLTEYETPETQEKKRLELMKFFEEVVPFQETKQEIIRLMDLTYPTQRAQINQQGRNLKTIITMAISRKYRGIDKTRKSIVR